MRICMEEEEEEENVTEMLLLITLPRGEEIEIKF